MFGSTPEVPQEETTPFYPRSPYAAAKVFSYWMTINYREAYNVFAVTVFASTMNLRGAVKRL